MQLSLPARPGPIAPLPHAVLRLAPGILLCALVSAAAFALQSVETDLFGRAWLEALVLAILLGTAIRTAWTPSPHLLAGVSFSAKTLLELAVLLLGASVSVQTIAAIGPALLASIAGVVVLALAIGYGLARLLRLPHRMAVLVASGNAICGNSAIAAIAPVIGADSEDVAASIAFTAILGVLVVLGLPLLIPLLSLSTTQFGVLAGLTVYAVPQVLAATAPVGTLAVQIGTLVKLVRVLMLGPVVFLLSVLTARRRTQAAGRSAPTRPPLHRMVPWFILGFLLLAALRSAALIPQPVIAPAAELSALLTVISMAALGLGVDVRCVAKAGPRVTASVILSLLALGGLSAGLIRLLAIA